MKLWSDTQMFFVVDTEFCQNEADDPQDAIVYFSPQDTPDSTKCTLCCHIMGICRFMKLGFSPVSLIRLTKGKFAIKTLGKYLLYVGDSLVDGKLAALDVPLLFLLLCTTKALSGASSCRQNVHALRGGPDMPDSILQRQLNSMVDIFLLLYNGFEMLSNDCSSRADFLSKMSDVWSFLLPVSQHHGDNLSLTFNIIPSLDLPKTARLLFLQASQFLQACQRFRGVYAGTVYCDQKVLCSQLPVSILSKLAFVLEKQRSAGKTVQVPFDLPGSVKLLFVYLSPQEVQRVEQIGLSHEELIDPAKGQLDDAALPQNGEGHRQTPDSEMPLSSGFALEEEDQKDPLEVKELEDDSPTNIPEKGECAEDGASSYGSCAGTANTPHVDAATDSVQDTFNASHSSSDATLTQETVDMPTSSASSSAGSSPKTSRCSPFELNNYRRFVLYVQGYNDTILSLILDDRCKDDQQTILGLWKLGMNTLMSLETDVRSCLEINSGIASGKEQDEKADSPYLYLQYDRKLSKARGDLKISKGSSIERQIFNRSAQLIHEDFVRDTQLYEATVCARDLVVYGHKLGARETYFHSAGSSPSDHGLGFPLQSDQMCTVATQARKKLEKERRLLLL